MRRFATVCGSALALLALSTPLMALEARSQAEPPKALEVPEGVFNIEFIESILQQGDAASSSGDLIEARRLFDEARVASKQLLNFYRDLSGAFRGLDARIPREMDTKGREALNLYVDSNVRLAALFRRQSEPEVAVPLLVEVVKTMTPANPKGRQAYQQLLEIGFVQTPYKAGAIVDNN